MADGSEQRQWTNVIGLMSGTSLDGLDCCYVEFTEDQSGYLFRNLQTRSFPYTPEWRDKLQKAFYCAPADLVRLDEEYGAYLARQVNAFIAEKKIQGKTDLIASHGHTVFHDPGKGVTVQIGSGKVLQQLTGIRTINDFRIKDVRLGGQGAPLVPVGDHYLFHSFGACLNLGGFSNISFVYQGQRTAFDICPCNLPINLLMEAFYGLPMDKNGETSSRGKLIPVLQAALDALPFYSSPAPKSLGFEWLSNAFMPLVNSYGNASPEDLLRTVTEHIAGQIAAVLERYRIQNVLVTGGGAWNAFLLSRVRAHSTAELIIPEPQLVDFKEALIFAFLGYLNLLDRVNTFRSVTGAVTDSIGGIRHFSD